MNFDIKDNSNAAPAVEVDGLDVIGFHCMDSAGIETLEWRGGSYADEPLCSMPKAQAIIDQLQAANVDLQLHFDTLKADYEALKSAPVVMPEWATSFEALGQRLLDAGWRDYADAQWDGVKEIFAELNRSKT